MSLEEREDFMTRLRAALLPPTPDSPGENVAAVLYEAHPADIAEAMGLLSNEEALRVFTSLDNARAAEVLDELDADRARFLLDNDVAGRIATLLDILPMDDAAEVVAEVAQETPERAEEILVDLATRAPTDAAEVRELLSYGEKTAGRLMTDRYLRVAAEETVEGAFAAIRRAGPEVESLSDLYVVESDSGGRERLSGVVSLRRLVRAQPNQRIGEVMAREPLTVMVDTDRQEAARIIAKYDFLALPVLDREGFLAGIVTVDDIIDVLVAEFNEDYLKLVGSDAEEMDRRTPAQVAKLRLPWLMGTMALELVAGAVIHRYDWVLREVILLASFMPVISAISGNVGLQAAAIIVRGLETGHVRVGQMGRAVRKEALTALVLAAACGVVLGGVGALWSRHPPFGLVVGGAMTVSMLTASLMGTVVPIFSKRLGFDPATTAGPFETAFQDVIGFGVFLWLASLLLPWLK
ncbi:MAG TPA: magnesium transporter [Armatimonadaceae bacterium]|nr:magnesium transporter [Armatimonadaceae bacterium]